MESKQICIVSKATYPMSSTIGIDKQVTPAVSVSCTVHQSSLRNK